MCFISSIQIIKKKKKKKKLLQLKKTTDKIENQTTQFKNGQRI